MEHFWMGLTFFILEHVGVPLADNQAPDTSVKPVQVCSVSHQLIPPPNTHLFSIMYLSSRLRLQIPFSLILNLLI